MTDSLRTAREIHDRGPFRGNWLRYKSYGALLDVVERRKPRSSAGRRCRMQGWQHPTLAGSGGWRRTFIGRSYVTPSPSSRRP
jgi:hypothetical protein